MPHVTVNNQDASVRDAKEEEGRKGSRGREEETVCSHT